MSEIDEFKAPEVVIEEKKSKKEKALDVLYPPSESEQTTEPSSSSPLTELSGEAISAPEADLKELAHKFLESARATVTAANISPISDGLAGSSLHGTRLMGYYRSLESEVDSFLAFLNKEGII